MTRELFLLLEQSEAGHKLPKQKKSEMKHEIDLVAEGMIWVIIKSTYSYKLNRKWMKI